MDPDILIGKHRLRLEPPDIMFVTNDGDVSAEEATAISAQLEAFAQGKDLLLVLFNVERGKSVAPQARKEIVDSMSRLPVGGVAMVGAAFSQRVLATLMSKAMLLLHPAAPPLRFFSTEAEARAWLSERRRAAGAPR